MKVLLSAMAFSPLWGSEPGVGWNWAINLAQEHEVTVLTHAYFRSHMKDVEPQLRTLKLRVEYLDLLPLRGGFHHQLLNSHVYYMRWQWHARDAARRLMENESFDLVHHITWGAFRYPSFLPFLGRPFVFGPVGGGERAPMRLFAGLPWKERAKERVRNLAILSGRVDPVLSLSLSRTQMIWCKTPQTLNALPARFRAKARLVQEIGASSVDPLSPRQRQLGAPLQLLFAGRLVGWKGPHLALTALALALQQGADAELTVVGSGTLSGYLHRLAATLHVGHCVRFVEQVPRHELMRHYREADVFLFPSLHDSSGNVIVEALSFGLPVICLDLGGPACFVDSSCAVIVPTGRQSAHEVAQALARVIVEMHGTPRTHMDQLSVAAIARAKTLTWASQVKRGYAELVGTGIVP